MNFSSIFKRNISKDTTVMDMIIDVFRFLCSDFGFVITETYSPFKKSKKDVVINKLKVLKRCMYGRAGNRLLELSELAKRPEGRP